MSQQRTEYSIYRKTQITPERLGILHDVAFYWLFNDIVRTRNPTVLPWAIRVSQDEALPQSEQRDLYLTHMAGKLASATGALCAARCAEIEPDLSLAVQGERIFNLAACLPTVALATGKYYGHLSAEETERSDLATAYEVFVTQPPTVEGARGLYVEGLRFFMDKLVAHAGWHPDDALQPIIAHPDQWDGVVQKWYPLPGATDAWKASISQQG